MPRRKMRHFSPPPSAHFKKRLPMQVKLTETEFLSLGAAGIVRFLPGVFRAEGFRAKWDEVIESWFSELAVAKALGVYLSPDNSGRSDMSLNGTSVEVRRTEHANGALILKPKDRADAVFILVTGRCPDYRLAGWIWGHSARREEWKREGHATSPPTWWVPQSALRPVSEFRIFQNRAEALNQ